MKFNFSLFHLSCGCGYWFTDKKWLKNFVEYRFNPNKNPQCIYFAWTCKRCKQNKIIKIIVEKHEEEYFVKNEKI